MAIEQKIIAKIESQLKALGAQYIIQMPSGERIGQIVKVKPQKATTRKRNPELKPFQHAIRKQIEEITTPGVYTFPVQAGLGMSNTQRYITGVMAARFGSGNYTTMRDYEKNVVEAFVEVVPNELKKAA